MSQRITLNPAGTVDEFSGDASFVHMEDLGNGFWVAIDTPSGSRFVMRITSKSGRAEVVCHMDERPPLTAGG